MSDRLFAVQFKFKQLSFFEFGRVPIVVVRGRAKQTSKQIGEVRVLNSKGAAKWSTVCLTEVGSGQCRISCISVLRIWWR
jgi:hypothetical protein